jgi:hypothetical protein
VNRATRRAVAAGRIRPARPAGLRVPGDSHLPPTKCPRCQADLHDPNVPPDVKAKPEWRDQFSLVLTVKVEGDDWWQCPRCAWGWPQ